MKKPRIPLLVILTLVFAAFLGGFFAGRNLNRTPVQLQQLPAPTASATESPSPETTPGDTLPPGPININTATVQELQTLPGIGPVLAQRIVDYRQAHGPFDTVGALIEVEGIGTGKLETVWDLVTTGG